MKILIAPAKKMVVPEAAFLQTTTPMFETESEELRALLMEKSPAELMKLYKCSEKTLAPVLEQMDLQRKGIMLKGPALLSYQGLAFRNMAPDVFDEAQWEYVCRHLYILSGLYGLLRPTDAISPYRLEMQTKLPFSLYPFWSEKINGALQGETLINLASDEYAKVIRPGASMITISFLEEQPDGSCKMKGTYAKAARGRMVRWMAEHQAETSEDLKAFDELGYSFRNDLSTPETMVFSRKQPKTIKK